MRSRELRVCGRQGHVLFEPIEPELAARVRAETAIGEAWRCLRCGDFVVATPTRKGPADTAPVPPRGRALRELLILRLLAAERVVRAIVFFVAAYGIHRFENAQTSLRRSFTSIVPSARPLAERLGVDIDHSWWLRHATAALHASRSSLTTVSIALAAYATIELVEGVGLWLARRWAEYLTVVVTAAFLPIEIKDIVDRVTVTRVGAFVLNVAAVVYLIVAKRLFGARGGTAAYVKERATNSLLEVEAAATETSAPDRATPGADVGMGRARDAG